MNTQILRRSRRSCALLFIALLFISSACLSQSAAPPNIILIMADQMRGDAMGCAGNAAVITPNLDRLAAEGVRFKNGYSSVPSCTPARSGLLTGLSPWHHGMLGYGRVARHYKYEMPRMLRQAGYYTFGIGKMHWFPQKSLHGFNGTLVDESGRVEQDGFVSDYRDWFKQHAPGQNPDDTGIGWNENKAGVYQLDEHLHPTYWTGITAVQFIKNYSLDKPLFLKVSFARPHSPYDPPRRLLDEYNDKAVPPPSIGDWCEKFKKISSENSPAYGDFGIAYAQKSKKYYYANITYIDEMIGKIITALKEKGMYENSIICFTADHGDMMGDHYHWRKTYAYQGSANIPFLMKWPEGMPAQLTRGSTIDNPVELRDFLPTFLDAVGAAKPTDMDGMSLLSLVRDPGVSWRSYIDLEHATTYSRNNYWAALTDGKWKYIWFFRTGQEQLFDLLHDPHENINLLGDGKHKKMLTMWRARMVKHLSERGSSFVKDHQLVRRDETLLYSPNFPDQKESEAQLLKSWRENYMGLDEE